MITLENYEIYYLDYLDGNLSAKLSEELHLFLARHPELKIDETELIFKEENIPYTKKQQLKIWNEKEKIGLENVELFAIAAHEKLLKPIKKREFEHFQENNTALQQELSYYQYTFLQPDNTAVFGNKKSLKKKEIRVLWPWLSAAAAFLILITLSTFVDSKSATVRYAKNDALDLTIPTETVLEITENSHPTPIIKTRPNTNKNTKLSAKKMQKHQEASQNKIDRIEKLPIRSNSKQITFPSALVEQKRIDKSYASVTPTHSAVNRMNNPIWAVTNLVGAVTNKEVDFRTAKATEDNTRGFRVKFGDFEIYKNSSKKM